MFEKMNPKDVRALKLGAIAVVATLALLFVWYLNAHWTQANEIFNASNNRLNTLSSLGLTKAKYASLKNIVPVFEMPVEKEEQKFLFQDSLNEQFKKSGVNCQPWEEAGVKSKILTGYDVLNLRTSGKCNINQLFDLLTNIKENPYLLSIEDILIKRDAQNKQQVEFDLTVSTPILKRRGES